jgi:hypothetical protein
MHQGTRGSGITDAQRAAVSEAMRIILEDDLQRAEARAAFSCAGCGRKRDGAGSVEYEGTQLCHECATRFELARVSGALRSSSEFLAHGGAGPSS